MPRAEISYVQAVDALKRLHAELGGKINANKREAERLADDMRHVEAVIKMMSSEFNLRAISARRRNLTHAPFKRGKGTQFIMDALRVATEPLTSTQVAEAVLRAGGMAEPTAEDLRNARSSVHSTLRRYQGKTVEALEGWPVRWRLLS